VRRLVGLVGLGALLLSAGCNLVEPTIEPIQGTENVTVNVVACDFDPTTGLATATFELTSEEEYSSVLLQGELSDQSQIVIGTGSGSVLGVQPGKTYRDQIVFSLTGEPEGQVTCDVRVDLVNPVL
jgi:hypothetical protein